MPHSPPIQKPFNRQASALKFLKALEEYQAATSRIIALTSESKRRCATVSAISKRSLETLDRFNK